MSAIQVKASETKGEESRSTEISFDFGDNLAEAVALFGEEVVFSAYRSAAKIQAQGNMRRMMKAGHSDEEIQKQMSEWKVGVSLSVENEAATVDAIAKKAANMSPDQLHELIEKMKNEMIAKQTATEVHPG